MSDETHELISLEHFMTHYHNLAPSLLKFALSYDHSNGR